jgi:hypothetical protein
MCDICSSGLLDEINRKRNWRPDRLIKWAGKRGLSIKSDQLAEHFDKHLKSAPADIGTKVKKAVKNKTSTSIKKQKTIIQKTDNQPGRTATPLQTCPADDRFLNEIIGRVFQDLIDNKYDLKIEYGFKAIELKQKISETTNVETRLLELLNEIRGQELAQDKTSAKNPVTK